MPKETKQAVEWAMEQEIIVDYGFIKETYKVKDNYREFLVDKVREYFNLNNINYSRFDYNDVKELIPA